MWCDGTTWWVLGIVGARIWERQSTAPTCAGCHRTSRALPENGKKFGVGQIHWDLFGYPVRGVPTSSLDFLNLSELCWMSLNFFGFDFDVLACSLNVLEFI